MKNYVIIGLIALVIALLGCIIYKNYKYNKLQVQTTEKPVLQPVQEKTDKNGNKYVEIKEQLYTQAQINKITDSIRSAYGKSKIVGRVQIVTRVDTYSKIVPIFMKDTIFTAIDSNRYIKQSFTGNLKTDSGQFHIDLTNDTMSYFDATTYHIFKANEHSIIINHSNPYLQTISGSAIKLKERKVQFCVGPTFGLQYNLLDKKPEPYIGIGIMWNIIPIYTK